MGAADFPVINDQTLPSIIEGEVARAIGHWDGSLSEARTTEFNYYYGKPGDISFGGVVVLPGWSQDVLDFAVGVTFH